MLLCLGVLDSTGAVDSGMLSDDSGVLSETLSVTELSSLEDDDSEELVLVELWLVEPVLDVEVEELLDVLLELFWINEGAEIPPPEVWLLLQAVRHNANARLAKIALIFFIVIISSQIIKIPNLSAIR